MAKESKTQVFYRCVKAQRGHPFAGLYAVEKVFIKDNTIYKKEIVKEWDLRILTEAALAKMGGSSAFDAYSEDHPELEDMAEAPEIAPVVARTAEDLKDLTRRKLNKELKLGKPE
jgi:hypothetical protein